MVHVPPATPVTRPVVASTVATEASDVLHEPPVPSVDSAVVPGKHMLVVPVMVVGVIEALTVSFLAAVQPAALVAVSVYIVVTVGEALTEAPVVAERPA